MAIYSVSSHFLAIAQKTKGSSRFGEGHNYQVIVTCADGRDLDRIQETLKGIDHRHLGLDFPWVGIEPNSAELAQWIFTELSEKHGLEVISVEMTRGDGQTVIYRLHPMDESEMAPKPDVRVRG